MDEHGIRGENAFGNWHLGSLCVVLNSNIQMVLFLVWWIHMFVESFASKFACVSYVCFCIYWIFHNKEFLERPSRSSSTTCTHQKASHCVDGTWIFVVGCPVKRDLAFDIRNPDVGIMLDKQLHVLWVIVVGTPMQGCLLQN